jgi:uncharacterized membrane protein
MIIESTDFILNISKPRSNSNAIYGLSMQSGTFYTGFDKISQSWIPQHRINMVIQNCTQFFCSLHQREIKLVAC